MRSIARSYLVSNIVILFRDVHWYDVLKRVGISSKKEVLVNCLTDPLEGRSTLRPTDILVFGWAGEKHACVDLTGVSPLVSLRDNGIVGRTICLESESRQKAGVGDFIELKVTDCVQTKKKLKLVISLKLSLKMDLSDYEVPRVLVTCRRRQIYDENDDENVPLYYHINKDFSIPFGSEEFYLVTGLRFRVQNWAEYDTKERIPFRRRVFPSYLDGQPITGIDIANMILDQSFAQLYDDDAVGLCCLGILQLVILGVESKRVVPDWMLRLANDRVAWDKYPWGLYVWPTLYSQLRNENVKRWSPLYVDEPTNEDDAKKYSIFGYTWAFKTWILESYRVTAIRYFDHYNRYLVTDNQKKDKIKAKTDKNRAQNGRDREKLKSQSQKSTPTKSKSKTKPIPKKKLIGRPVPI
ncbi:phospholipase-like protein [Tanacetum coccineum]